MTRRLYHASDEAAVAPAALATLARLRAAGLTHRHVRHVRSSQAFALNLFAPLTEAGIRDVMAGLGLEVQTVEPVAFEFVDPTDRLREASRVRGHQTQVDVVLGGYSCDGRRVRALIEVKLGEVGFGGCSAFENPQNPDQSVCQTPGLFGGRPTDCFQLRNHGHGQRLYADYLAGITISPPHGAADDAGCYVRADRSQPMRNLALAHALVATGDCERAVFAVCAPATHPTIWRRYEEFRDVFSDTDTVAIRPLTAEQVITSHPDRGADFRRRYAAALLPQPQHAPQDGQADQTGGQAAGRTDVSVEQPAVSPERITALSLGQVFVFGSNARGRHGSGAARYAMDHFGAVFGEGHGLHGQSYAIDTMSGPEVLADEIGTFLTFAAHHPELTFLVTEIGCGIAGYRPPQVAPLFQPITPNVALPRSFWHAIDHPESDPR